MMLDASRNAINVAIVGLGNCASSLVQGLALYGRGQNDPVGLMHHELGGYRPGWEDWFDRQMEALEPFDTTVTFCFTPDHLGIEPHHTSPPKDPMYFADFCARMIDRYASRGLVKVAAE